MKTKLIAFFFLITVSLPGFSQFKWGAKVVFPFNKEEFGFKDPSLSSIDLNDCFQAGIIAQGFIPNFPLGMDASALISMNSLSLGELSNSINSGYLNIPVNLKYRIGIPVFSKIFCVCFSAGPYFNIKLVGKDIIRFEDSYPSFSDAKIYTEPFNWGMNYSIGLICLSMVQVDIGYSHTVTRPITIYNYKFEDIGLPKNFGAQNGWFVTASILF